ncbi:hypothetical protein [Pseudonocardia parietis]|uniref:FtsH-binding integral membrane protein n=1 Tax=Pseudonocardia parietis TaxID=570936 RepID=A0ABS4W6Y2_9PSEU|nr:hypothetical protein [Pseudonocardia parietis]MBP2371960.1 FtsH-binding integral membrane protein [Pseudonocardia parietis]
MAARIGAGAYVLWGALHLGVGVSMVVSALTDSSRATAGELGAESTMFFVCAAVLGAQAIGVGVTLNRRNDRAGYWINLLTLGVVDAAFVPILVVPGHVDLIGGLSGPALWLVAAIATTTARLHDQRGVLLRTPRRNPAVTRSR